jgi:hypothetical protein
VLDGRIVRINSVINPDKLAADLERPRSAIE